ncbi:hypothetical protein ACUOCP_16700 [Escherichia sp. R-CC3]
MSFMVSEEVTVKEGGGERFSDVEYCGADEYLYPGLVEKKLFPCTFFAKISIWEACLLRVNS